MELAKEILDKTTNFPQRRIVECTRIVDLPKQQVVEVILGLL